MKPAHPELKDPTPNKVIQAFNDRVPTNPLTILAKYLAPDPVRGLRLTRNKLHKQLVWVVE